MKYLRAVALSLSLATATVSVVEFAHKDKIHVGEFAGLTLVGIAKAGKANAMLRKCRESSNLAKIPLRK